MSIHDYTAMQDALTADMGLFREDMPHTMRQGLFELAAAMDGTRIGRDIAAVAKVFFERYDRAITLYGIGTNAQGVSQIDAIRKRHAARRTKAETGKPAAI